MSESQFEIINGVVEEIIYRDAEKGFCVIAVDVGGDEVTVVGDFTDVGEGEELEITGNYSTHPLYGLQFRAVLCERTLPETASAILRYLSSGVVKGVGPALARRMVDRFGDDTLDIAYTNPEMLSEIKGISKNSARLIGAEFKKMFGIRELISLLSGYEIGTQYSVRAYRAFGEAAVELVKNNPYMLCGGEIGLAFEYADSLARDIGFERDSSERIHAGIIYILDHNMSNGHTCLPENKVISMSSAFLEVEPELILRQVEIMGENGYLSFAGVGDKKYVFLPWLYNSQHYIADRLQTTVSLFPKVESSKWDKKINRMEKNGGIKYEALQRKAVEGAMTSGVLILTGGPGTGKTTTINAILTLCEDEKLKVAIAAPTGRAAKRLSEITGREAKTIHRLLEVSYSGGDMTQFVHHEKNPLDVDVVIIDEMSMVDTHLFEALLRAIKLNCRIILVGDSDQLPSVGAGNILKDLISSECFETVELREIFRQAAGSLIVTNAHDIVSGKMPNISSVDNDFFFIERHSKLQTASTVVELVATRLPRSYGYNPLRDIQVLVPTRLGEAGTVQLSRMLQQQLNPPGADKKEIKLFDSVLRQGDKIMQIKNNYELEWDRQGEVGAGIYNGDIGIIKEIDSRAGSMDILFDDRLCKYPIELARDLELAYAVTVHKSQGSEFEAVILPLSAVSGKLCFRNLLYTAVTRAKKILIIVGDKQSISAMVKNERKMRRYTLLTGMIQDRMIKGGKETL